MDFISRIVFEGFRAGHIIVVLSAIAVFNMFDKTANDWRIEKDDAEY